MDHHAALPFLRETLLFLTLAGILIPLLQRLQINQVLGFLVAGIALGPHAMGQWSDQWPWLSVLTFQNPSNVQSLAELGVVFLMFLIGLEISPRRLWDMRRWVFGAGISQVLLSAGLIGAAAWAFGVSTGVAIVVGLVLALSSTAMVMQLLIERRALTTKRGKAVFGVLMLQDFAVIPLLILIDLLAADRSASFFVVLGEVTVESIVIIGLIYVAGRRLIGPLFRFFANRHQPEVFMALSLLVTLGTAGLTAAAGLSLALGAFLAGLLVAETEYRHKVEITLEPFKGLLLGLFFMSVGMGIDVESFARQPHLVLLAALALCTVKAIVASVIFRASGLRWGASLESGLLLAQGGEFAFVILGYGMSIGLVPAATGQFLLLVTGLSMLMTTGMTRLGEWLRQRIDTQPVLPQAPAVAVPAHLNRHMVIAGFGRVGQLMASILEQQGVDFVAIEQNATIAAQQSSAGKPVFYGNAARIELLDKLHAETAAALIVTIDQPEEAMQAVRAARQSYPHLPIYARSRDEQHAQLLRTAGATGVIPETLEAGLQLSALALAAAGLEELMVSRIIQDVRHSRT